MSCCVSQAGRSQVASVESRRFRRSLQFSASFAAIALASSLAMADPETPTGGQVVSGAASIGPANAGSMTITQSSQNAIISWDSFSVGAGGNVRFENGNGATLNRVTGNLGSQIDGTL